MGEGKNLIYCFSRSSNLALPDEFLNSVIQDIFTGGTELKIQCIQDRESPWPGSIGETVRETRIPQHDENAVLWESVQGHGGLPGRGDVSAETWRISRSLPDKGWEGVAGRGHSTHEGLAPRQEERTEAQLFACPLLRQGSLESPGVCCSEGWWAGPSPGRR